MISEILVIGDEIRSGSLVDSNSAYIARKLKEKGVEVARHSAIGDDPADIINILKEISQRSNVAVVMGGLSSIGEDLKVADAAKAEDVSESIDTQALVSMKNFFKVQNRPLTHSNKKKAMLPSDARCLGNSISEAPGFHFKIGQCDFFFLPGVPSEMRQMLT